MRAILAIATLMAAVVAWASPPAVAGDAPPTAPAAAEAPPRFDGRSAESFAESRAAIEAEMDDTARFAFHMKLAQVRAKLAEQRGRPLTDAEFAAALDGKTLAELDASADAAPTHITIDIETSDDT